MTLAGTPHKELKELHALLADLTQYESLINQQKIVFFKPLVQGDQHEFFAGQTASIRLVLGSNRSGKTACGSVEAIAHSLGFRPWLAEDDPLRVVRLADGRPIPVPNVGRIIAQNFEQAIRQTIMAKMDEWAPKAYIKRIEKNTRGIPVAIYWVNGSVTYLMSNDQDDMSFEGPSGHWFWADEPIDYRKFTGLRRGLVDFNGHCWMTMTPLSQPWINDIIVSRANDPNTGVRMYKFSIWDNCDEVGGYLSRMAIESFLADLREDELEARLHGNFLHLAGLVYKEWEPVPPFWIPAFEIPLTWPRVMVTDPHPRKPVAVLWAACSPDNIWYIYRTLFDNRLKTVEDVADHMKVAEGWMDDQMAGSEAEPVVVRIIDWSAEEDERTSGTSVRALFAEYGLPHIKAKKVNAAYGYDALHKAFNLKYEWSKPGLVVFDCCAPMKQNLMNFCYDEWASSKQRDLKGEKEEYRKANDDFIDAGRYLYQSRLTYNILRGYMLRQAEVRDRELDQMGNGTMFTRDGTRTGYGRPQGRATA